MSKTNNEIRRLHCNKCGHETKHENLLNRTQTDSELYNDEFEISWFTVFDLFECLGCEDVVLRRKYHFSEWGHNEFVIDYYPPRIARSLPDWKDELPSKIEKLLEEVYTALQADSRSLAMMGARALIDMVILDKVGDAGTFPRKLEKLQKEGFLSDINREVLEAALDVGNAASHRGHRAKIEHVQLVMDIVENLLQSTILQGSVDELRNATPKRGEK